MKPEAAVQKAVLDLLAAERVLAWRMNSGALMGASGRPISFGVKGMADVLALPMVKMRNVVTLGSGKPTILTVPLWIECKFATGRQSPEQRSFQEQVESRGCAYIVARSSDDVLEWLRAAQAGPMKAEVEKRMDARIPFVAIGSPLLKTEIPLAKVDEYNEAMRTLGTVRHDGRDWYVQNVTIEGGGRRGTVVTAELLLAHRK